VFVTFQKNLQLRIQKYRFRNTTVSFIYVFHVAPQSSLEKENNYITEVMQFKCQKKKDPSENLRQFTNFLAYSDSNFKGSFHTSDKT